MWLSKQSACMRGVNCSLNRKPLHSIQVIVDKVIKIQTWYFLLGMLFNIDINQCFPFVNVCYVYVYISPLQSKQWQDILNKHRTEKLGYQWCLKSYKTWSDPVNSVRLVHQSDKLTKCAKVYLFVTSIRRDTNLFTVLTVLQRTQSFC